MKQFRRFERATVWFCLCFAQLGLNTPRRYLPPPDGTTTAAVRTAAAKNFSKITAPLGGDVGQGQFTRRTEDTGIGLFYIAKIRQLFNSVIWILLSISKICVLVTLFLSYKDWVFTERLIIARRISLLFFDNFPINSSFCSQLLTKEEWYTTIEYYIHIYSQKKSWFTSLHAMGVCCREECASLSNSHKLRSTFIKKPKTKTTAPTYHPDEANTPFHASYWAATATK